MEKEKKKSKLKIIIPIVAVLIIVVVGIVIFMCNKSGNNGETSGANATNQKYYSIGETIETDVFNYTITSIEFVSGIECNRTNKEDFFTPTTRTGDKVLINSSGHNLLYFTGEYQFKGKESFDGVNFRYAFVPTVEYEDYKFNSDYFVFHNRNNDWYLLSTDLNYATQKNYGLDLPYINSEYKPLDNNTYLVRGVIGIPEEASSNLIVSFSLVDRIEGSTTKYLTYKFKVD